MKRRSVVWAMAVTLAAGGAHAQTPVPSPLPERLGQDRLDFQARSDVVQGSGARAFGMGGAFLARPDDATAASWNPAGLSYLRLPEVSLVGVRSSFGSDRYDANETLSRTDERSGSSPDLLAVTYPLDLGPVNGAAQVSFQRVIAFDSDRRVEDRTLRSLRSRGGFDVLALGTGLQVLRRLRVGVTINRWFNGYEQTFGRLGGERLQTRQTLEFDLQGWNAHLGAIWTPWEQLNLGAVFKNRFDGDVRLARSRTDFPAEGDVASATSFERSDVTLEFPGAFGLGASWRPYSPLTVSADFTRTFWSNGRIRNYFVLDPTASRSASSTSFEVLPYPTYTDDQQQDTAQVRAGVEYVILHKRLKWPLRAGYFTDRQLFRALGGRPPRFEGVTLGTGLALGPVLLDVAYVHEFGDYVELAEPGAPPERFSVAATRFFASIIYRHRRR